MSDDFEIDRMPAPPPPPPRVATREDASAARFGVVLFDDEKDPGAAWCAVNGKEAKRISGVNELPTDTIWWSNMTYESFFRGTEAWRNPWLRHDAYLVVKPKDVLQEWGNDPATTSPDYVCQFASTMFGRIMMMAYRLARDCDPKVRMNNLFVGETLRADLRRLLPKAEYPEGEAGSIMKSGQAWAEFTRTTVRGVRGGKNIMLRRNRVSYCYEILGTPMPRGPFEFLDRATLRKLSGGDRVAWMRNVNRPCMADVAVQQMEGDVAPIYGFGNATDKERKVARSWVAHPEFLVMSTFSEMEIRGVYMGREYSAMLPILPEGMKKFLADKFTETSWSAGVIAETIWRAAALGEEKSKQSGDKEDRAHTSWRGAWVKAADKTAMFLSAMKLTGMGYATVSYGLGWVQVQCLEDQIPDLVRDALTIGLAPKLGDVPDGLFSGTMAIPWGGDKKSKMLSSLTMSKQIDMLWNLDRLPLYEKEQRQAMLMKLIAASKNPA